MYAVEAALREIADGRNAVRSARPNAAPQPALRAAALRGLQRIRFGDLQLRHRRRHDHEHASKTSRASDQRAWPVSSSTPPPISKVVPETNSLTYRGYPVQDLAAHCSFEEVAYLIWHGELPTDQQLALFTQRERAAARLNRSMLSLLAKLPDNCHPMDVVRTAISYLGAEDADEDDSSAAANYAKSLRMMAVLPTIVAADHAPPSRAGPRSPRTASWATRRTSCTCASARCPNRRSWTRSSSRMVLYAEHSFNASTFAARVVTSTQSDIYSAVTGGDRCAQGPAARRRQRGGHARHDRNRRSADKARGLVAAASSLAKRRSWASVTGCTRTVTPGCRR